MLRLRRALGILPEGTPLWVSAMWHLGAALEAGGKNDQALLYYIKSYAVGAPDIKRRSVIENLHKKVNGTLDGRRQDRPASDHVKNAHRIPNTATAILTAQNSATPPKTLTAVQ